MVGWTDVAADLSDGPALARLRDFLPDAPIISSTLSRAVATADAIQGARPRLAHDPDLREIHFGDWEMQRFDAVTDQPRIHRFWDAPGEVAAPGGESWNGFSSRVARAVARLTALETVIVVAHFGTILTQVQRGLRVEAREAFGHRIDNLSVTEITLDADWSAGRINFLP